MERKSLKAILLLDDLSRSRLKGSVSDLVAYGLSIITDLRELNSNMVNNSNTLILLEDVLSKEGIYSDLVLYKDVFKLNYIFLSTNDALIKSMSSISDCYKVDPSSIDYEVIYSVLSKDMGVIRALENFSLDRMNADISFAKSILSDDKYDIRVKKLAEKYLSLQQMFLSKIEDLESLEDEKAKVELLLDKFKDRASVLETMYLELIKRAIDMNKSLKQYEVILSKDVYDKVQLSRYPNKPRIIYFKEYEKLMYLNSFISVLFDMFRYQGKQSVKVIKLLDSSSSKRVLTLPSYYKVLNRFSKRDIVHDFIAKVGAYRELLDVVLTNSIGLDLLIIIDCKDHNDTVLSGQYLQLSMCSNPKHLPLFGLTEEGTVVNAKEGVMSWYHYDEYSKMSDKERFLFLSSRPVMQRIFEMNRIFNE